MQQSGRFQQLEQCVKVKSLKKIDFFSTQKPGLTTAEARSLRKVVRRTDFPEVTREDYFEFFSESDSDLVFNEYRFGSLQFTPLTGNSSP